MAKVAGSNRCGTGVAQGYPIGRWGHPNRGQTSLGVSEVEAVEHPIVPYVGVVVGATLPHPQDPDEQNLWAGADPKSSSEEVGQVGKCKKAVGPLG